MSLVLVGLWLVGLGACDLGRPSHDLLSRGRLLGCLVAGLAPLLVGLVLLDLGAGEVVALFLLLAVALVVWLLASARAMDVDLPARSRSRARVVAFAAPVAGAAVAVLGVQLVGSEPVWPARLDATLLARWPAADLLVATGVVLAQLVTANILVRLLLDAVGVPATSGEKQLKGGRVLGPMERVFLTGLGALGELTAAAIVVAAKGLLRFPELQRAQRDPGLPADGPSDVTEYFLIGSFASWLLALGGAALIHLA